MKVLVKQINAGLINNEVPRYDVYLDEKILNYVQDVQIHMDVENLPSITIKFIPEEIKMQVMADEFKI